MQWVTFDKFSVHDWTGLDDVGVGLVDFVNRERGGREVILIVERTVIMVFVVFCYLLCILSFLCSIDASRKYWRDIDFSETHCHKIFLV